MRRQGSVVTIDLEALTCRKEKLSADTTAVGMSIPDSVSSFQRIMGQ